MNFRLAILGRPNVGKSTLFNRLCGASEAIVHPNPGVTRDRRVGNACLGDLWFEVIDTAGLEEGPNGLIEKHMQEQTRVAIAKSEAVLLLIDAQTGVTTADLHFANELRKTKIPVILIANKCEGTKTRPGFYEAYELGLGEPIGISAEHGDGLIDLYSVISTLIKNNQNVKGIGANFPNVVAENLQQKNDFDNLQIVIVGRPNVGKSTLLNCLLHEERVITGPEPGVTRDSIAVEWNWQKKSIKLIDTAGLRRPSRVTEKIEKLSTSNALRAVRFAHVAILVLDGSVMAERQDLTIANYITEEGRGLIIAVNKWDLVKDPKKDIKILTSRIERSLPQVKDVPIVKLSALNGKGMNSLMPALIKVFAIWNKRLSTGPLNRWLKDVTETYPPPLAKGRRIKLRYITQVKARPPTFVIFSNRPSGLPTSYHRFLINGLRRQFGLRGVPIRLNFRQSKNPFVEKNNQTQ